MSRFISVSALDGSKIAFNVDRISCAIGKENGTEVYIDGGNCVLTSMPYPEFVIMVKAEDYE